MGDANAAEWVAAMAGVLIAVAVPVGWLYRSIAAMRERLIRVETQTRAHDKADEKAHGGFHTKIDEIMAELKLVRAENLEQHRELETNVNNSFLRIHEKMDRFNERLGRLPTEGD